MTYTFTSSETGRTFTFPSEEAYEAANEWYNGPITKDGIVDFCAKHGVDLTMKTDDPAFLGGEKLTPDWADVAMELYAKVHA